MTFIYDTKCTEQNKCHSVWALLHLHLSMKSAGNDNIYSEGDSTTIFIYFLHSNKLFEWGCCTTNVSLVIGLWLPYFPHSLE